MSERTLPGNLTRLLQTHGAAYDPHYPPSDNSDHGPMAYLAMHGLGIGYGDIATFAEHYRGKLVAAPPLDESVDTKRWQAHIGRRASYSALLAFFNEEIARRGWQETVARHLPRLISGWVKDAFHPLIRLGYGIEFEAESEIAAGLAYLTITGDDPKLAQLARSRPSKSHGRDPLHTVRSLRNTTFERGPFNARYQRIVRNAPLAPAGANSNTLEEISRACLEVFHTTHDFFALHLVTSSHAFRVCAPWAGPQSLRLFSAGIAAAYLAIAAPEFEVLPTAAAAPLPTAGEPLPIAGLAKATDEHDIKLAYSAQAQAQAFGDPTYRWVAVNYLTPRLPAVG